MKHWIFGVVLVALVVLAPARLGHGQEKQVDKPDPKKVKELMRRKLDGGQKLLEALAVGDLGNAGAHAEGLLRVSKDAAWLVKRTPQYDLFSDEFRQNAEGIIKAAKDKNLQSARLNYLGLTMSCFNCHSYVREQ